MNENQEKETWENRNKETDAKAGIQADTREKQAKKNRLFQRLNWFDECETSGSITPGDFCDSC